jgi:hypothetical protein
MTGKEWLDRYVELRKYEADNAGPDEVDGVDPSIELPEHLKTLYRLLEKHHQKTGPKERTAEIESVKATCSLAGESDELASRVVAYESEQRCYIVDESDPSGYYRLPKLLDL